MVVNNKSVVQPHLCGMQEYESKTGCWKGMSIYMLYTYLVLVILHESLSLEMATDYFTYRITYFGLTPH